MLFTKFARIFYAYDISRSGAIIYLFLENNFRKRITFHCESIVTYLRIIWKKRGDHSLSLSLSSSWFVVNFLFRVYE